MSTSTATLTDTGTECSHFLIQHSTALPSHCILHKWSACLVSVYKSAVERWISIFVSFLPFVFESQILFAPIGQIG